MKNILFIIMALVLLANSIAMFFQNLDQAIEIDSLKQHIVHQKNELIFLQNITNKILVGSHTKISVFEKMIQEEDVEKIVWQENETLIRAFKIIKDDSYIKQISLVAF